LSRGLLAARLCRSLALGLVVVVGEQVGQLVGVVRAAPVLSGAVVCLYVVVVERFHRQGVGDEPGAWCAVGDPQVDRLVNGEAHDVVGGEASSAEGLPYADVLAHLLGQRDIDCEQLPESMKRAMARQAEAEREKRTKIIAAQGEALAAGELAAARAANSVLARP
jgi:hypothetical protein